MKIAILGTRGIPMNYGGFEQVAEYISQWFLKKGHEVTVFNPIEHPYEEGTWNGVKIQKIFSREDKFKFFSTFIYDFLSLRKAIKDKYDIILELGAGPSGLFFRMNRGKSILVTNVDGLEWQRSKWGFIPKLIWQLCEKNAVKWSDAIVTDNIGIQKYFKEKYPINPHYIPYGAQDEIFHNPEEELLPEFQIKKYQYYLIICRFVPENNFEMILDGYLESGSSDPMIVVAAHGKKLERKLIEKYSKNPQIKFVGAIYGRNNILNTLRHYSKLYFHGHSVGGTNPSLLEAMNAGAVIAAHDNIFNRSVLHENALYFTDSNGVKSIIDHYHNDIREGFILNNYERIKSEFNWEYVSMKYLSLFEDLLRA